jgi:hypothetical protein
MKKADKKKLLVINGLYWIAAIVVPPLLHLIPTSHPPKILPLLINLFLFTLAGLSTYMWNQVLGQPTDVGEA